MNSRPVTSHRFVKFTQFAQTFQNVNSAFNGKPFICLLRLDNNSKQQQQLECGPMPNLMAALPNMGGALCSTPQSLADAHY